MSFAWPLFLWLLPLPLLLLLAGLLRKRGASGPNSADRILRGQAGSGRLTLSESPALPLGRRSRPLLSLACAGLLLGLARPQWGVIDEPVYSPSREILIGLDLSRSMLATDIKPSRLERAKLLVQSLLDRLRGERIGLVVFSGTSFLQSPLSTDYEIMRDLLPSLGPDFLPEGGTAYKAMLKASLDAFSKTPNTDRFLIILSDGEALDDDWKPLVAELKERRVRVLGLGVGTTAGSLITDETGALVKDERGAAVLSKLEPATLEALARDTGGRYRDAGSWIDLSALVRETVESASPGERVETQKVRLVERFQWPLAAALALGLLSLSLEFPGRIRPRQLRIQNTVTKAAPMLLLGLLLAGATDLGAAGASPVPAAGAGSPVPASAPAPEPALLGTVRKLSEAPTLGAEDCRRLAEDTLDWGTGLRDGRQAFPLGPVNDALEAVGRGEKLDASAADWARLREQLNLLLQPPKKDEEQQKQDKKDQDKKEQDKKDQQQEQNSGQKQEPQQQDKQQSQDKSGQPPPSEQKQEQNQDAGKQTPPDKQDAFGKMQAPPQPPPPQEEMQQVGGAPAEKQEINEDPNLVVPLEKLQKLKSQDNPGRLFELMQDEKKTQPANKKNW